MIYYYFLVVLLINPCGRDVNIPGYLLSEGIPPFIMFMFTKIPRHEWFSTYLFPLFVICIAFTAIYLHYPYCEWSALIYYETVCIMTSTRGNRFQPQIDRVQNRGTFLWTVINKTSGEIIRSTIDYFRTSNI